MDTRTQETPGTGRVIGYNPDEVAHGFINPAQRPLRDDGIKDATLGDQEDGGPGNGWVQVLMQKKKTKRETQGLEKQHAIYADDITLWCREGSDAEIEEKLQAAADIVGEYVMRCGLKCAPEKSELLVFRNPRDKLVDHIDVVIDGVRVPKPAEVRILGQLLQQGRGNKSTIDRLDAMTTQVCGMMRRIRNRRHGIKEKEAIQLVQAFIIARLTYGTPYLNLNKAEMQKLNVLIKRAYKNALGLPERTATEKLLKLGVHNTTEELHEAQLVSQLKRLSSTVNGAWLLDKLGMAVPGGSHGPGDAGEELPAETRQRFTISRIPRNMHPDRNAERRQARAVALARSWDSREGTLYVDGAGPVLGVAAIAVASAQGQIRRVASIRAQTVEQVEEAAIALAVVCNPRATIILDSGHGNPAVMMSPNVPLLMQVCTWCLLIASGQTSSSSPIGYRADIAHLQLLHVANIYSAPFTGTMTSEELQEAAPPLPIKETQAAAGVSGHGNPAVMMSPNVPLLMQVCTWCLLIASGQTSSSSPIGYRADIAHLQLLHVANIYSAPFTGTMTSEELQEAAPPLPIKETQAAAGVSGHGNPAVMMSPNVPLLMQITNDVVRASETKEIAKLKSVIAKLKKEIGT
ncbi:hypothetical protein ISCGN_032606 [Ixodes scapularis]